jgi:hypothetical protein
MNFIYIFQYLFFFLKTENINFEEKKKVFLINLFWMTKNVVILIDHCVLHLFLKSRIKKNIEIDENMRIFFTEFIKINKKELIENLKNMLVEYLLFVIFKSWYYRVYFFNIVKSFASCVDESLKKMILNN